jgi:hypothetical protein
LFEGVKAGWARLKNASLTARLARRQGSEPQGRVAALHEVRDAFDASRKERPRVPEPRANPFENVKLDKAPVYDRVIDKPVAGTGDYDPLNLLHNFYLLESMRGYLGSGTEWDLIGNRQHIHFSEKNDFTLEQRDLVRKEAPELISFLAYAVASELENADVFEGPKEKIPNWVMVGGPSGLPASPDQILENAREQGLTYAQFALAAADFFSEPGWHVGWGGENWVKISKQILKYNPENGSQPDVWLDYVFHLHHNKGTIFDKLSFSGSWDKETTLGDLKAILDFREAPYEGPEAFVAFLQQRGFDVPYPYLSRIAHGRKIGAW